jgi:hypothetical protein
MLSIICRNQKIGTLSGHLQIAPKKGEIKRMLSMRYRFLSVCSACAAKSLAYAQRSLKNIKRMLSVRLKGRAYA